jgi:hypothetical protein
MAVKWEYLSTQFLTGHHPQVSLYRAKVPGGWLVLAVLGLTGESGTITFYPDPGHAWDGSSLP